MTQCAICQKQIEDEDGTAKVTFNADPFWNIEKFELDICKHCSTQLIVALTSMSYAVRPKEVKE